jgi:hypothetical protein
MIADRIIRGRVRGGVIVPEKALDLPEGTHVEIRFLPSELSQELQEEFAAWNRAGDDAWAMIEKWEHEEKA